MSKFRVGQTWCTRGGETCAIVLAEDPITDNYPIYSDLHHGHWHRLDGTSCLAEDGNHEDDLIKMLSDPD